MICQVLVPGMTCGTEGLVYIAYQLPGIVFLLKAFVSPKKSFFGEKNGRLTSSAYRRYCWNYYYFIVKHKWLVGRGIPGDSQQVYWPIRYMLRCTSSPIVVCVAR